MYADRYAKRTKIDPGSAGLSLALIGVIVAGLAYSSPTFVHALEPVLTVVNIPVPPAPKPEPLPKPEHHPKTALNPIPHNPDPIIRIVTPVSPFFPTPPQPSFPVGEGAGGVIPAVKPAPVMAGPEIDPRYAGSFQPEYPAGERRAEHQGRVVVRVLIGIDGRVKQVERVSAASDAFFDATERRALEKWRFKPGTRDGVPVEAWRTMAVSFVLNDE